MIHVTRHVALSTNLVLTQVGPQPNPDHSLIRSLGASLENED
jgi:hypothetical protein